MMFAALVFEREPPTLSWDSLVVWLASYVQSYGTFAAIGLFIVFLAFVLGRREGGPAVRPWVAKAVKVLGGLSALGFLALLLTAIPDLMSWLRHEDSPIEADLVRRRGLQMLLWTAAAALAMAAVLTPVLADLPRISLRRILAIARLSFKEAVRRKVLWAFLGLLLVILFGSWFIPHKFEDQVRNYVWVVSLAQLILLVAAAMLIASFGIPDDIRQQTIHTVVTKPVERFEIFLGRFLGYFALLSLVLVITTAASLLYVVRGVDPDAAADSLKARLAMYGDLEFEGTPDRSKGENVGREWEYRSYIYGPAPNQQTQYAIWNFPRIPSSFAHRDKVPCEFNLDIYRTTKGVEGQGVFCTFLVETWRYDADNPAVKAKYDEARRQGRGDPALEDKLAEEYGFYEVPSKEILDYHTQSIEIPAGIFRNALAADPARRQELERLNKNLPPVRVRVRCDSRTQFVGMAKYDLFLREDASTGQAEDTVRFCVNFFRGSFGTWMLLALVLAAAVAFSTYLSGVITLLAILVLCVLGLFHDFIQEVALGRNVGGGPFESTLRLMGRQGGQAPGAPLEQSTGVRVSTSLDQVFTWTLRRVLDFIPDLSLFNFTDFVAEGVAIRTGQLLMTLLMLGGYVLFWAVLAYYLLKWREVASTN